MFFLLILLICLILFRSELRISNIDEGYFSKDNTTAIKGFFIGLVFLSHVKSYLDFSNPSDLLSVELLESIGQLMVTMFLFISGFGVYESIKAKGKKYIDNFPAHRILKTFIDFAIAIFLFILVDIVTGRKITFTQVLLSFTGWTSLGNSNWYMFAIFCLYITTYISFKMIKNNNLLSLVFFSAISIIYVYFMSQIQPDRFSNTYLCYAAGMWFSFLKNKFDLVLKKDYIYWATLIFVLITFVYLSPLRLHRIIFYNAISILFCIFITLLLMKIHLNSKILYWLGNNLFWIYILQRIPMILLSHFGMDKYPYSFIIISLLFTIVLTKIMNSISKRIKTFVFSG